MDSKTYVLTHDFGYGKEPEQIMLNKLELRNIEDLKIYLFDVCNSLFIADISKSTITFQDGVKIKLILKENK